MRRLIRGTEDECEIGYFGEFCNKPCPPGSFGFLCGGKCFPKCSKEDCNHVSGCPNDIQTTSTQIHTEAFTTWKTNQNIYTSSTTFFPSKTSTIIDTENRKIEINMNHLLVGGGIFLSLILLVILLQLYTCRRSTTTRTNTLKKKTCKEMRETDESEEKHDVELARNEMPLTREVSIFNQPAGCDYHDIDEIIEIRHLPSCTNAFQEYELPRSLPKSKHAYLPLKVENGYLAPQVKDDTSEQREGHSRESTSDIYLQPIHVI